MSGAANACGGKLLNGIKSMYANSMKSISGLIDV